MCGIVGFTGNKQAAPILLDGLLKLEYDSVEETGYCCFRRHYCRVKNTE